MHDGQSQDSPGNLYRVGCAFAAVAFLLGSIALARGCRTARGDSRDYGRLAPRPVPTGNALVGAVGGDRDRKRPARGHTVTRQDSFALKEYKR